MPALHRYARRLVPGYFPIQQLSLELILEIFAWCAPLDLVILRSVSRHVKAILDQHGHRCWTRARNNLLCLPAVPPLPNSKYSEIAFINYFFNSGCNKCCSCGRSVDNALHSQSVLGIGISNDLTPKHRSLGWLHAGPSTTFPILTPICYLVTAFDNGVQDALCEFNILLRLGMDPIEHGPLEPNECIQKSSYIQLRKHYIHARDELIPAIETNLTKVEPLLITELHGSYELELFLRFIKKIPWFSSARINLLDDIPTIFSSLRSSLRAVLVCLEYVEHHAHNFLTCFLDVDWVNRQRGRTDLLWCLDGTRYLPPGAWF
ncbi:hypothetical protein ARMSODRAFT_1019965 [Armillaria solidipes]|uniref:F-box domain-containing protein n=1 Tax=Armillaria solidipes TaxID=1076256 RepID=A0A2H3BAN6_9AGAR|nr:hypothetical protein ARMSODRAFT_1019965 [Armillaria solidipes]